MVLPLLAAAAAVWWMRRPDDALVPRRPPPRADPEGTREALCAEQALPGAVLVCWLAPAELSDERQEFQARALLRRYDLPEGQAFRMRVELRPEPAATSVPETAVDLSGLWVADESGRALAPFALPREMDPLATLLSPCAEPLRVGCSLDLMLWGRAPGQSPKVEGVFLSAGAPGPAAVELSLAPRPVRSGDLAGPLARLDGIEYRASTPESGKSAESGASRAQKQGSHDARY